MSELFVRFFLINLDCSHFTGGGWRIAVHPGSGDDGQIDEPQDRTSIKNSPKGSCFKETIWHSSFVTHNES